MDGFRKRAEAVKSQKRLSQVGKSASHMPPHMASHASPHMPPHMPPHMGPKEFFQVQHINIMVTSTSLICFPAMAGRYAFEPGRDPI